ncbi:MAG: 2'-5' RNA ligase family protein [Flavobacterium sp.]|uniref:2'-5' RNA ligase family protein n=1 Tax=Flavobacterium sp. TaxID=239 RepID=UPI0011F91AB8|nr:2'-5' RNA ligase family protein [Flavobacterium sp.]RZJ66256.1 MAG: 2'-5' RNA ligase family protein [Flavobacterium sp.]
MQEQHYSIVFRPSESVIAEIRDMKRQLAETGNYGSRNAEAHITVLEFFARENQIAIVERYMQDFASSVCNLIYRFDRYGSFPEKYTKENGVFYVAPTNESALLLDRLSAKFHEHFPLKGKVRAIPSGKPHMTIGRRLQQQRVDKAYEIFSAQTVEMECVCTLALRVKRINFPEQFKVMTEFEFTGEGEDFSGNRYSSIAG